MSDTRISYPKHYLYRRIVQAKIFMDNCYAENLDISLISDEAYFSRFHFIRLFKKIYSKTPHQYLREVRLSKAQELLKQNIAVSEVCSRVGFESVSSFTGLFKRTFGLTPSSFQKRALDERKQISEAPLKYIPHCFARAKGWSKKSNFQEAG